MKRGSMDTMTRIERSERMSRVRSKNTKPEMAVRRLVHAMGYRFRLHRGDIPGKPDLVFVARRKIIFVHGCFWHRHQGCPNNRMPKSRVKFWKKKLLENRMRDKRNLRELKSLGWQVLIIWECEARNADEVRRRINRFLD